MDSNLPQISRESIWILSNVAAGTEEHVTILFDTPDMGENILRYCRDYSIKKRKAGSLFFKMKNKKLI